MKKKILYIVILIAFPVTFNRYPINPLLALSFENIGIKTVLNKILFLRYIYYLFLILILPLLFCFTQQPALSFEIKHLNLGCEALKVN